MIDHRTKGFPGLAPAMDAADVGSTGWNVLRQDVPLPVAVLRESALNANSRWMRDFVSLADVSIAPHGKTTMCPQLFRRQLADGAWAITLSTAHQVAVARDAEIARILLANQIVDPRFVAYLHAELRRDPAFEFLCLVDSVEGADFLDRTLAELGGDIRMQVLVEIGTPGGRTGVRGAEEAAALAMHVKDSRNLVLRGVEGFEGAVPEASAHDTEPVVTYLDQVVDVVRTGLSADWFEGEPILSLGGSSYYDLVQDRVASLGDATLRVVLRSGCYLAHDNHMYQTHFAAIRERSALARGVSGSLQPALEVLAYVQSVPEPGLAIVAAGRRDLSYDDHLPIPLRWHRPGAGVRTAHEFAPDAAVTALNDQHAFLALPGGSAVAVGDIVVLGVSHPCTTFDKWHYLYGVDDEYSVVTAYRTYF